MSSLLRIHFILLTLLLTSFPSLSQNTFKEDKRIFGTIKNSTLISTGDYAPFWMTNNNFGIASEKNNKTYSRLNISYNHNFLWKNCYLSAGLDFIISQNLERDLFIQQGYIDINIGSIQLSGGMKERFSSFVNKKLSSGNIAYSYNTRPIPQIKLSIPSFIYIPFTDKYLEIKAGIAYGWFMDNKYKRTYAKNGRYTNNALFHQKYGHLKINTKSKWSFIVGVIIETQWGGDLYNKGQYEETSPHTFKDFLRVTLGKSGGSEANLSDQINRLGNSYGYWDIIANYEHNNWKLKLYHQHIWEDKSGIEFSNIPDGLYGIEIHWKKKQLVSTFLFEFLYTKDQSGKIQFDKEGSNITSFRACDNYYNNSFYQSASNYGLVIGNPLLISPMYNNQKTLSVKHNAIIAYHTGINGFLYSNLSYRLLATYSRSYGTPSNRGKRQGTQLSSLFELTYLPSYLKQWKFGFSVAYDHSKKLVGNNKGVQLQINYHF